MSALLKQKPHYNVAAFIEYIMPFPDHERWELLDGEPVLMSPQSERHQRVVSNLLAKCRALGQRKGCAEYPGLGVLNDDVGDYAPIPDVLVRCGPVGKGGYVTDPVLVAEVLSPSTAANDQGRKLEFYKTIASLRTILIIDPEDRRVENWTRHDNGWSKKITLGAGTVPLAALDSEIKLAEIYAGLEG
jgi:Uma2 family endonuclease